MQRVLLALVSTAVFYTVSVTAVCDSSSGSKIQQCVFQSELFNPMTAPKDETSIQNFCRDKMNTIVDCMEQNRQECNDNPKEKKLMNLLVSIPDIRAGMTYMCNNISVLVTKASCFQSLAQSSFSDCLQNAVGEIAGDGQPSDLKSGMDSVCRFFDSFTGCFTNPFNNDECNVVGMIYGKVFDGIKYPYCKMNTIQREAAIRDYQMTSAFGGGTVVQYSGLVLLSVLILRLL